jgi:TolB-like protein/Flp pilus assembly protein TadD
MSDHDKAVFLSYASQDADSAKKICEALRAAGVEVWFDQSELVGGDAWDQKIRKQIKECALLVPVISKTTQGRREAYFRLEWKLADERTHLMARGTPFLLPVTIDETNDREALVPDSFLAVQWTKLPGGEAPPAFVARVKKLLEGNAAGVAAPGLSSGRNSPGPAIPATAGVPKWLKPILAAAAIVIAVLAGTLIKNARQPAPGNHPPVAPVVSAPAVASASPARELVAKVYVLIHALETTREDYALAEEYCQRALKLDPDDGEVWAAYSQVHSAFGYRGWDGSSERREQVRVTAERAIRLAPRSVNARIALAGSWSTFGINREEREKLLREIVAEDPGNQGALRFLAVTVLAKPDGLEECLALNERSAALPGGDPLALFNNARYLWQRGRVDEGYATLQRALAQQKFTSALVLKMAMEINSRGDLAAAEATLAQIPPGSLQEDRANYEAGLLRYYQGNAAGALGTWQAFPRDFYNDFLFDGPKGLLLGLADELDHREAAARTEWRAALQLVEKRIAAAPNKPGPYYSQAYLLACLGEKAAATEALRTHEQLAGIKYLPGEPMTLALAQVYARLGRFDEIFAHPPTALPVLRISPYFAALRADPRFAPLAGPKPSLAPVTDDDKSIAVLAFANLSSDKEQEYFSDGISEELLNVLAKIPDLKVAARTSAFYFKSKEVPVPEIARQLGVAYVVEGSVRKSGDKVRITAQLIKAADGFHVWSDTFTRDLKDIFGVQDEIAGLIAKNLELKMGFVPAAKEAISTAAYQEYLLGRAAAAKASMSDLREAVTHFSQAVSLEPKYTAAWVQLATAHTQLGRWGGTPPLQAWAAARGAIDRARALEPDSPDVLLAAGWILRTGEWNWRGAEQAYRRALALRPNHADTLSALAVLLFNLDRKAEAFQLGQDAARLDPLNAATQIDLSLMFYFNGSWTEAELAARRALQLAPEGTSYHSILGWSLALQGRYAEAEAEIARCTDLIDVAPARAMLAIKRRQPDEIRHWRDQLAEFGRQHPGTADLDQSVAWASAALGENDVAFAALERSVASRDPSVSWLRNNWPLRPLEADPRWPALLRRVGLADDQRK